MKTYFYRLATILMMLAVCSSLGSAQGTTSSISGTVTDPNGASVSGASVTIRNTQTNTSFDATTTGNGTFTVPALPTGIYQVTVTVTGFKQTVVNEVKLDVGTPSTVNVQLEIGAAAEVVEVVSTGEIINTQNAQVSTTLTGRQIIEQPQASRDALDLVTLLPGVQTTGRPRTSTINGLPKGALNITIDGVDVQDNLISSNDGFFTFIRPRIDAIQEVTVSTATPGAESNGEGAAQIKFVTARGTNEYRGGLYWYHRQPGLNANYFFNNQAGLPRIPIRLNQYGGKVGGPLPFFNFGEGGPVFNSGKDRAFFFVNYEEFRLPEAQSRNRTILNQDAAAGLFRYGSTSVNVLELAGKNNLTSTVDPTIAGLISAIGAATSQGSLQALDLNRQTFSYNALGSQIRKFATGRLDFNLAKNHQLENITNYQIFDNQGGDLNNNFEPSFPGFPAFLSQISSRYSNSTALRSTLTPNLINEARFTYVGGTITSGPLTPGQFASQNGVDLVFGYGLTDATALGTRTFGRSDSRRSTPVYGFTDNLTWLVGNHTLSFGGGYNVIRAVSDNTPQVVPIVTLGIATGDPANAIFNATNFPGASAAELTNAAALYAFLTGRVTNVARNAYLNNGVYELLGQQATAFREPKYSLYVQDSWRARPNLTITAGLRWEPQLPATAETESFSRTTYEGLFGVSGVNNLFQPGTLTGQPTQFTLLKPGEKLYNADYNNFAPSVGIAWNPSFNSGLLRAVFGGNADTVFRGGYSMAFVREGLSNVSSISQNNPGGIAAVNRNTANNTLPLGSLLRDPSTLQEPAFSTNPTFPFSGLITNAAFGFDPDLKTGVVHSWTVGVQRALTKDTVLEVRYVGTRADDLWRRYNLNEINVVENNFLPEFQRAQANLIANRAAGLGNTFAFTGAPGTAALPTTLGFFQGLSGAAVNNPANYTSAFFTNSSFLNTLSPNNANITGTNGFATLLVGNPGLFNANRAAANIAANFFVANPDKLGGASITTNGIDTTYHALQVELRRRLSAGLFVQANYTFSKSLANAFASSQTVLSQPLTLRPENEDLESFRAPQDIRHAFKASWIYELPFGNGRTFFSDSSRFVNALIGGFEFHGTARIQSGRPFTFGNVQLVGITKEELQKEIRIRKTVDRSILPTSVLGGTNPIIFLPEDIILNTTRAFNTSVTSATGYGTLGAPTGRYIAPANSNGCIQAFTGQCGYTNLILDGPMFTRFDLSLVKKVRFTERMNLELRGEFLNAFNNINFFVGGSAAVDVAAVGIGTVGNLNAASFGTVTNAYQDVSTTNDPGGRIVQLVLRLNF